jgi:prepilin-type N-terminal cleavage/methylation domain-containing protein
MKHSGVSLIEVLVAMTLVLCLLVGAAELLGQAIQAQRFASERLALASLAAAKIEELKTLPFENPSCETGIDHIALDGGKGKIACLEWQTENTTPDLKKITLKIYLENRREQSLAAALLISRHLGF